MALSLEAAERRRETTRVLMERLRARRATLTRLELAAELEAGEGYDPYTAEERVEALALQGLAKELERRATALHGRLRARAADPATGALQRRCLTRGLDGAGTRVELLPY